MSNSAELLKPLPAPAPAERASQSRQADKPVRDDRGDRFEDRLSKESTQSTSRAQESTRTESSKTDSSKSERADEPRSETDVSEAESAGNAPGEQEAASQGTSDSEAPLGDTHLHASEPVIDVTHASVEMAHALPVIATPTAAAPLAGQVAAANMEAGALGRWFMQATGPAAGGQLSGQMDQMSAVQQNLAAQNLAAMAQDAEGPNLAAAKANGVAGDPGSAGLTQALADRGLTGGANNQSFENLITQAAAQATAKTGETAETTTLPSGPTAGQTLATGAQSTATAVPQAATGQAVPVTALAVEITRQAMNGNTKFDIRLDPPELGRLNVRLEMDASGQTRTHMIVERAETLEMLLTDSRSLERALQQAGMKADAGSVTFELAGDGGENFADGFAGDSNTNSDGEAQEQANGTSNGIDGMSVGDEAIVSSDVARQTLYLTGQLDVRV